MAHLRGLRCSSAAPGAFHSAPILRFERGRRAGVINGKSCCDVQADEPLPLPNGMLPWECCRDARARASGGDLLVWVLALSRRTAQAAKWVPADDGLHSPFPRVRECRPEGDPAPIGLDCPFVDDASF